MLKAIVPGNAPVTEVLDSRRSDALIEIFISALVCKTKVRRTTPIQAFGLRLLAEQLRFEDSVPFFFSVTERHFFDHLLSHFLQGNRPGYCAT